MTGPDILKKIDGIVGTRGIVRPVNILLTMAGTLAGAILALDATADIVGSLDRAALAALAVALTAAAGNVMNDIVDRTSDSINRPDRPLASTSLTVRNASLLMIVSGGTAIVIASRLSGPHAVFVGVVLAMLAAYNLLLKRIPLVGNVVVAALVAASLLFGAFDRFGPSVLGWPGTGGAGSAAVDVWIGSAFAFWLSLAREIVKDIQDVPGDTAAGISTWPVRTGVDPARRLVIVLCGIVTILTVAPYAYMQFSGLYLMIVLVADMYLIRTIDMLAPRHTDTAGASASLKKSMAAGLLALTLAHIPAATP